MDVIGVLCGSRRDIELPRLIKLSIWYNLKEFLLPNDGQSFSSYCSNVFLILTKGSHFLPLIHYDASVRDAIE